MKVLAINSSARTGDVSKTEIVLDYLLQGMREAGADVTVVELRKRKSGAVSDALPAGPRLPGCASTKTT